MTIIMVYQLILQYFASILSILLLLEKGLLSKIIKIQSECYSNRVLPYSNFLGAWLDGMF